MPSRARLGALTAILVVIMCFNSAVRATPYIDTMAGIAFPDTIGELKFDKATDYRPEPGENALELAYNRTGLAVTVYIRAKESGITAEAFLEGTLDAIREVERQGVYSKVQIYHQDARHTRPGWKGAMFTARVEERFIASFIYCTVHKGHPVEVRASASLQPGEAPKQLEAAAADIDVVLAVIDGRKNEAL